MNTKSITLIAIFAAISIALNAVRIPTIYWPGFSYHFNEIPIVVAFLLFGPKISVLVGVLQLIGQEALFPVGPVGIVVYPMGFVALLMMFFGVYLGNRFIAHKDASEKSFDEKKRTIYLTAFAAVVRGGFMPLLSYGILYRFLLPLVLGTPISESYIAALVPSFVIYNVTVPLYTIPISYVIARKISNYLKLETESIIPV
jgi:riboflavin transporter FmnP